MKTTLKHWDEVFIEGSRVKIFKELSQDGTLVCYDAETGDVIDHLMYNMPMSCSNVKLGEVTKIMRGEQIIYQDGEFFEYVEEPEETEENINNNNNMKNNSHFK